MGKIPLPVFVGGGGGDDRNTRPAQQKPLHQTIPVRPQSSPARRRRARPQSAAARPSSAYATLPTTAASSDDKPRREVVERKRPQSAKPSAKLDNPFRDVDVMGHFFPHTRELWNVAEGGPGAAAATGVSTAAAAAAAAIPVEAAVPQTRTHVYPSSELDEELLRFRNSKAATVGARQDAYSRLVVSTFMTDISTPLTFPRKKHASAPHRIPCPSPHTAAHVGSRHAQT